VYLYWDIFNDLPKQFSPSYFNVFTLCFLPGFQCEPLSVDIDLTWALFHGFLPLSNPITQPQIVYFPEQIFIDLDHHPMSSSIAIIEWLPGSGIIPRAQASATIAELSSEGLSSLR
jgi:hypothetical protein